ncbi:MAG: SIS domain-containing protein [Candidatus Dormibacteria bacterium]
MSDLADDHEPPRRLDAGSVSAALSLVGAEVSRALGLVEAVEVEQLGATLERPRGRRFFTGQGRSGFVARMAAMRLMQLGGRAHVVGEATTPAFGEQDVLVVISASGATPTSLLHAQQAHALGGTVCCLTTDRSSPIALLSEPCVILSTEGSVQFRQILFTQAALLLLDGLALALAAGDTATQWRKHANIQ